MSLELVRRASEDGLILQGLLWLPEKQQCRCIVVHIHGSTGNFYENFFIDEFATQYAASGIGLLSVSTRGRDYYSDFKVRCFERGYTSVKIGGIREVFQESLLDLRSWLGLVEEHGCPAILQGHSLGAMKVAYVLASGKVNCAGAILLSPPDMFGLIRTHMGDNIAENLRVARDLVAKDPNSMMPDGVYFDPITATSYISLFANPNDTGCFSFADSAMMQSSCWPKVQQRCLVTFGTVEEATVTPIQECVTLLKRTAHEPDLVESQVIEGANHNYHDREEELVAAVVDTLNRWLT